MKLQDVVDYAEHVFDCKIGYPGAFADGSIEILKTPFIQPRPRSGSKRYRTLQKMVRTYGQYNSFSEHQLCCDMINAFDRIQRQVGGKPRLYWRYLFKVEIRRYEDIAQIYTRIYVDGCIEYGALEQRDNDPPQHLHLAVDNTPKPVPLLALNKQET